MQFTGMLGTQYSMPGAIELAFVPGPVLPWQKISRNVEIPDTTDVPNKRWFPLPQHRTSTFLFKKKDNSWQEEIPNFADTPKKFLPKPPQIVWLFKRKEILEEIVQPTTDARKFIPKPISVTVNQTITWTQTLSYKVISNFPWLKRLPIPQEIPTFEPTPYKWFPIHATRNWIFRKQQLIDEGIVAPQDKVRWIPSFNQPTQVFKRKEDTVTNSVLEEIKKQSLILHAVIPEIVSQSITWTQTVNVSVISQLSWRKRQEQSLIVQELDVQKTWFPRTVPRHWIFRKPQATVEEVLTLTVAKTWIPFDVPILFRTSQQLVQEQLIESQRQKFIAAPESAGIVNQSLTWNQTVNVTVISQLSWRKRQEILETSVSEGVAKKWIPLNNDVPWLKKTTESIVQLDNWSDVKRRIPTVDPLIVKKSEQLLEQQSTAQQKTQLIPAPEMSGSESQTLTWSQTISVTVISELSWRKRQEISAATIDTEAGRTKWITPTTNLAWLKRRVEEFQTETYVELRRHKFLPVDKHTFRRKQDDLIETIPFVEETQVFIPPTEHGDILQSVVWHQTVSVRVESHLPWLKPRVFVPTAEPPYPPPLPFIPTPVVETSVTDTAIWTQTVVVEKDQTRLVRHGYGLNQTVKHTKIITLSCGNSYSPQNNWAVDNEDIEQDLTLTQSLVKNKTYTRAVTSHYTPTQTVVESSIRSFALSNQLVFQPTHSLYVPILGTQIIPNLIVTVVPGPPASPVNAGLISGQNPRRVYPWVTLQVPNLAITLPAPEFDDSEAYAGTFTIRRSMNGLTYTYVHKLNTSKLKYDFMIGIPKMFELESYLLNFNSKIHQMTNWKGEIWIVFITNNPMDMVTKSRFSNSLGNSSDDREKVAVTLEFEGTRIH